MHVLIEGLDDHIERVVEEKLVAALAAKESDPWLTTPQAAAYLGIAVSTLHDLVCDGRLPRHGPRGHRLRFRSEELDAYARGD